MLVAGFDFETNGTDAKSLDITEIGAVLRDSETKEVVERFNTLVWDEYYPPQPEKIIELTGITDEMLRAEGVPPLVAMQKLQLFFESARYGLAYNKVFDETVNLTMCERLNIKPTKLEVICAYTEVPYPEKYTCRKLSHLALDHGIKMDNRSLHRATDDVELMFELTDLYSWESILAYAKEPWVFVQAIIPAPWTDGGKGKAAATARGYGWERARGTDGPVFPKSWVRRIKEGQLAHETSASPFRIVKLS